MRSVELETAIRHAGMALRHPRWWARFLAEGREGLLGSIIEDSILTLRSEPVRSVRDLPHVVPTTPLGRLGAPQEYLYRIVRALRPGVVVETGVYRGISSAFLLAALEDNAEGRLYSIDLPGGAYTDPVSGRVDDSPLSRGEQVGFAVPHRLRSRWELALGDSRKVLPDLMSRLGSIEMFYHDSQHTYDFMTWEYETAFHVLAPGGILASDDVNWNSAFGDFAAHRRLDQFTIMSRLGVLFVPQAMTAARASIETARS